MTAICLPAGTDVAEMALFDVDALPRLLPRDVEGFAQLTVEERLVRFPTGADGGYLLHLFVNEAIPKDTERYCISADKLTGHFHTTEGRIAFGGMESAYAEFRPNANIRSDGLIAPGRYAYTAYRTEFPDESVAQALRVARTASERWLDRAPLLATLVLLAATVILITSQQFVPAGLVLLGGLVAIKWLRRLPGYRDLVARRELAQLAFPSIVIALRSDPF
ncbi:MAG: hypothetical protein EKK49_10575 [Rhodocyclaceae bacterium]|nr:MAG: hypothetical protein EKK49_10575 [Rhodocyclaceae bacterium]